jgi:hypothetical protein
VVHVGFLEDPVLEAARPALQRRLDALAAAWDVAAVRAILRGAAADDLRDAFDAVGATEGTLWIVDAAAGALVPAFNSGPDAARFVAEVTQPLGRGLVAMVLATQNAFCENAVWRNAAHDGTVDRVMGRRTLAMIAVPFFLGAQPRGVVSCVRLGASDSRAAGARFTPADLRRVRRAADALTLRLEHETLRVVLGWPTA